MSFSNQPINSRKPTRGGGFRIGSANATMSTAMQTVMSVHKVSEAKEFEAFRNLPKFSKPILGVIHPSPQKKKPPTRRPDPDVEVEGSPARMFKQDRTRIEIPEHLMKAPADSFGASAPRPRSQSSNKKGKLKGGLKNVQEQQLREAERKKNLNAERIIQEWFTEIKANLEKDNEADFND